MTDNKCGINQSINDARKSDEIERELQFSRELNNAVRREIDRWMERMQTWDGVEETEAAPMEGITTSDNPASPTRPMEGITIDVTAMPTIEKFSEGLISSWGLDDSRHAPNRAGIGAPDSGRNLQTGGNSGDPPTALRRWSEKWIEVAGDQSGAKATRRIDLPRTLGYSNWKPKYPTSRTKLKKKKREGRIQPIGQLHPRQNAHKLLTHLGRARNQRLKRDGHG
jgi:hypothetical protein